VFLCLLAAPVCAQTDTSVFKLLPNYHPEEDHDAPYRPGPEIISRPALTPPQDPALRNVKAVVWVNILVDTAARIRDAQVVLSDDRRFDAAALAHARKFRFRWRDGERPEAPTWVSLPVRFGE
jgi:TonB family protein